MSLYTFSPIQTKDQLLEAIKFTHFACYQLCQQAFGQYFANSGNMGIFCQYDDEYERLTEWRKEMTEASDSYLQKYFRLHKPIVIPAQGDVPETTYTFLYIRRPDPYRHQVGDVDFYIPEDQYRQLKQEMLDGKVVPGARVFDRPDLDMIELYNPDIDALGYVTTHQMTQAVHAKLPGGPTKL